MINRSIIYIGRKHIEITNLRIVIPLSLDAYAARQTSPASILNRYFCQKYHDETLLLK